MPSSRPDNCDASAALDQAACFTRLTVPRRNLGFLKSIDPALVRRFRNEIETKLLANHTGEKAPYRMLLPSSCCHESSDGCAGWGPQHCKKAGVLGIGARRGC